VKVFYIEEINIDDVIERQSMYGTYVICEERSGSVSQKLSGVLDHLDPQISNILKIKNALHIRH
jgi:hypothetical protein